MQRRLQGFLDGCRSFVLTGSGSSQYAGECVHPALRAATGISACTLGGGWLLSEGQRALPAERPLTLISLARSGDSPESGGVVEWLLETEPQVRHLVQCAGPSGHALLRRPAGAGGHAGRPDQRPQSGDDIELHQHGAR
jgi:tagatose-6-phosphate ketose/aldose isomerase